MDQTPHLALPYLAAAQAQKHVTVNEALARLDALVAVSVAGPVADAPPQAPVEGARYAIGRAPEAAWADRAGAIATWRDGEWEFLAPPSGLIVHDASTGALLVHDGEGFAALAGAGPGAGGGSGESLERLGINAPADDPNRLAVASDASLFTHEGGDHRLAINKAGPGDTASLVLQQGYSGRAEIGLAGNDRLAFKVSPDGAAWREAIAVDPATGHVGINAEPTERLRLARGNLRIGWNLINADEANGGAAMEVMYYGTGDRFAYFDFHASDRYTDYAGRLIRGAGADGNFVLFNRGAGALGLNAEGPGTVELATNGRVRLEVKADGRVGIGTSAPTTALDVAGPVRVGRSNAADLPPATAAGAGALAWVSDRDTLACCDGTVWRRVQMGEAV